MPNRLVIVSCRAPFGANSCGRGDPVAALEAALNGSGEALWFGWSGRISDHPAPVATVSWRPVVTLVAIDLTTDQTEGLLNGFSNKTLWPLFHGLPDQVRFQPDEFALHRDVNRLFAKRLVPMLRPDDRIWIRDYNLIPLGWMLREAGVTASLGLFLHPPFPPAESLAALPWQRELARDLGAFDLIGFQTRRDQTHFEEFIRAARRRMAGGRRLAPPGALPATDVLPIGIDTVSVMRLASSAGVEEQATRMARSLRHRTVIVAVDRLDHVKGLAGRFRAYERLLDEAPEYRGATSMVQVTAPSCPPVPGYIDLRMEQQDLAERINARYMEPGWVPIFDIYASLAPESLAALFRLGRVALATPLRDGMSMVAKEYVAAQDPGDPGVLILSRTAGAAETLAEALIVDPGDIGQMANALRTALRMPLDERRDRWWRMIAELRRRDSVDWHRRFLASLSGAGHICRVRSATDAGAHKVLRAPTGRVLRGAFASSTRVSNRRKANPEAARPFSQPPASLG